jgi:superfamily II helicase
MNMKFSIGEKVKVRGKDMVGEVVQSEYKHSYRHGEERVSKRYLVKQMGSWHQNWYDEEMLESVLELSDTYAAKVYDLLIDVNLMVGNFDMVKMLVEEKKKHLK